MQGSPWCKRGEREQNRRAVLRGQGYRGLWSSRTGRNDAWGRADPFRGPGFRRRGGGTKGNIAGLSGRGGGFDQRNTTRNTFHSRERLHAGKGHPTVEPCQPAESMLPLSKGPSTRHQSPRLRPSTRFALFQWCLTDHAGRESPSEFVSRCHPWGQRCFT